MAIDLLGLCLNQDFGFIGRHDVVVERLDGTVSGGGNIENSCHLFPGLERVFHDFLSVAADLGVMLTVEHRLDAINAFCTICTGSHFL